MACSARPGADKTVSQLPSHYVAHTFKKKNVPARWDVPLVIDNVPKSYIQQGGS